MAQTAIINNVPRRGRRPAGLSKLPLAPPGELPRRDAPSAAGSADSSEVSAKMAAIEAALKADLGSEAAGALGVGQQEAEEAYR